VTGNNPTNGSGFPTSGESGGGERPAGGEGGTIQLNAAVGDRVISDDSGTFSIPRDTFVHTGKDTLRFEATLSNGAPLPDFVTFNEASGTFIVNAAAAKDAGAPIIEVMIKARDSQGAESATSFAIRVAEGGPATSGTPAAVSSTAGGDLPLRPTTTSELSPEPTVVATIASPEPQLAPQTAPVAGEQTSGEPRSSDTTSFNRPTDRAAASEGQPAEGNRGAAAKASAEGNRGAAAKAAEGNRGAAASEGQPSDSGENIVSEEGATAEAVAEEGSSGDEGRTTTVAEQSPSADATPPPAPAIGNTGGSSEGTLLPPVQTSAIKAEANDSTSSSDEIIKLAAALSDQVLTGESSSFSLPQNAFVHSDPAETLSFEATLSNGAPLPDFVTFNEASGTFSVNVQAAIQSGQPVLDILVKAKDTKGNQTTANFAIRVAESEDKEGNEGATTEANQAEPDAPPAAIDDGGSALLPDSEPPISALPEPVAKADKEIDEVKQQQGRPAFAAQLMSLERVTLESEIDQLAELLAALFDDSHAATATENEQIDATS
jgi:hypothetical protein